MQSSVKLLVFRARPAFSSRCISTLLAVLRPLWEGTQDAFPIHPLGVIEAYRGALRHGPVLNPGTELLKYGSGLSAIAAKAMIHTRDLKISIKVVSVGEKRYNALVVVQAVANWNITVGLLGSPGQQFCHTARTASGE